MFFNCCFTIWVYCVDRSPLELLFAEEDSKYFEYWVLNCSATLLWDCFLQCECVWTAYYSSLTIYIGFSGKNIWNFILKLTQTFVLNAFICTFKMLHVFHILISLRAVEWQCRRKEQEQQHALRDEWLPAHSVKRKCLPLLESHWHHWGVRCLSNSSKNRGWKRGV